MRKAILVLLASSLMVLFIFGQIGNNQPVGVPSAPSIHQGDLILGDNNVTTIEGEFVINGSIIVEGNATLILRNAVINFTQTSNYQHNMTFKNPGGGNPHLYVENATVTTSNYYFRVNSLGNSTMKGHDLRIGPRKTQVKSCDSSVLSVNSLEVEALYVQDSAIVNTSGSTFSRLWAFDSSNVTASNITVTSYTLFLGYSFVNIADSRVHNLQTKSDTVNCSISDMEPGVCEYWSFQPNCSVVISPAGYAPNVTVVDTLIEGWSFYFHGPSNATLSDSIINELSTHGQSTAIGTNCAISMTYCHDESTIRLVNSTSDSIYPYMNGKAYASWHLGVHVMDSIGQDVPSANVTAFFPNSTVVGQRSTDGDGLTGFILMGSMVNATGEYPVGNYRIQADYDSHRGETTVGMTGNKEIEVLLEQLVIPESQLLAIFALIVVTLFIRRPRRIQLNTAGSPRTPLRRYPVDKGS